jgi:hypothetical protein
MSIVGRRKSAATDGFSRARQIFTVDKLSAQINRVTSHAVSEDGTRVTLCLDAKHVGELALLMSAESLDEVVTALQEAQAAVRAKQGKPEDQVRFKVPKNWLVSSDLQVHDVVLLVFDHKSETQAGYALGADAAKKMAVALVQNADAAAKRKAQRGSTAPEQGAG